MEVEGVVIIINLEQISQMSVHFSVQFSPCLTLRRHRLQHTRLPCLPSTPRACSNSMSIESVMPSNHLILSSPSPPAFNLSQHQGLFQWAGSSHQVAKVLELQHQSFWWISVLKSFRIDWFGLLAVQGTLKSLLQHHSSKASILCHSAFLIVQLSHSWLLEKPFFD